MKRTKIEWCDSTFNPVTGCLHTCPYCYARTMINRFSTKPGAENRLRRYEEPKPIKGEDGKIVPYPHGFAPTFYKYRLEQVRHWKDEKPRNIFICSMADLFGEWVPVTWILATLDALAQAPQHRYIFLTKNPARMARMHAAGLLPGGDNYWYGTTSTGAPETEVFAAEDRHSFISMEPILQYCPPTMGESLGTKLDWLIIGAETGRRKEKVIPEAEWIENAVKAAKEFDIPVFMKDSLVPIIGEDNMLREFPEALKK